MTADQMTSSEFSALHDSGNEFAQGYAQVIELTWGDRTRFWPTELQTQMTTSGDHILTALRNGDVEAIRSIIFGRMQEPAELARMFVGDGPMTDLGDGSLLNAREALALFESICEQRNQLVQQLRNEGASEAYITSVVDALVSRAGQDARGDLMANRIVDIPQDIAFDALVGDYTSMSTTDEAIQSALHSIHNISRDSRPGMEVEYAEFLPSPVTPAPDFGTKTGKEI